MSYKVISGSVFEVSADSSTAAWELFKKFSDGTATAEEQALITDTGTTAFELRQEGDAVDPE
jgi:hypothetical protein